MAISDELTALENYLASAYQKCEDKGATMPNSLNMANLTDCIDSIQGGGTIVPPEAGTLTGIAFGSLPNKTTYTEGEDIDLTGCVILGTYSSGQIYNVTANCTFTVNTPLMWYDTQVLITLDTYSLTLPIVVNGIPVQAPSETRQLFHFNNNIIDEVSGLDGRNPNLASFGAGKFGEAVRGINFSNQKWTTNPITLASSVFNTGSWTIEWWIKLGSNATSYYQTMLFNYTSGSSYQPNRIFTNDNIKTAGLKTTTSYSFFSSCVVDQTFPDWQPDAWNHIAIVIKNNQYQVYLNGQKACHGNKNGASDYGSLNSFSVSYDNSNPYVDELLVTASEKYVDTFIPNHAPYYLPSND